MSLAQMLGNVFAGNAPAHVYTRIARENVRGVAVDDTPLRAGQDYFRLTLCEMRLAKHRKLFTSWYPAVHSLVKLQYGTQSIELPHIAGPLELESLQSANLGNVIQLNHRMTGLLPYNGGVIDLAAGMLALQGDDALPRIIGTLSKFGGILQIPQLSAGLAVAGPLATGIQSLLVGADGSLALGLHQSFAGSGGGGAGAPVPGYFAALLADSTQADPASLHVIDDRLLIASDGGPPTPVSGIGFMLFRLDRLTQRDDWEGLADLVAPFDDAVTALLVDRSPERAEALVRMGAALVLRSPDLTRSDRLRVVTELKQRYDSAKALGLGAVPADLPPAGTAYADAPAAKGHVSELDLELAYGELFP